MTTVTSYFDSAEERDAARAAFEGLANVKAEVADRERVDWLDRYQQSLEAMNIGERFVVAPDASLFPPDSERLRIVVPQEQAFGTGSHETTSLCIERLETLDLRGAQGLDVGAGSGILALAMLRLGAARVLAFDNDLDAYAALRDNRIRNGIPERDMPLFIGRIESLRRGTFDVITMNILAEIVIELPRRHPPASGLQRTAHPQRHPHLAPRRRRLRCQRLSTSPTRGEAKGRMVGGSLRADTAGSADLLARPNLFL